MTEQSTSGIGTVAQEAARLIEDMATMARSGSAGEHDGGEDEPTAEPSTGACSRCGAVAGGIPETCGICPLCRGIALLRSVRPETVDLLADLALSVAASLRDVATRSRASDSASPAASPAQGQPDGDRPPVQDIHVDDESEG